MARLRLHKGSQHLAFEEGQEPASSNEAPLSETGRKRGKMALEIYIRQNQERG